MIAKEFYGDKLEVLETARTDMLKLLEEFPDDKRSGFHAIQYLFQDQIAGQHDREAEEKISAGDPGIGAGLSPRRCGNPGHLLLRGRRL